MNRGTRLIIGNCLSDKKTLYPAATTIKQNQQPIKKPKNQPTKQKN